ncbi:MAG: hypothetical protein ACRCV7_04970 [Culicoidibacterales bacterium]
MDKQNVWQETHAYQVLTNLIANDTAPQNVLFTGSDSELKHDLTQYYLQNRFCETEQQIPCLTCQSCQLIAKKLHPDVYWYEVGSKFGKDEMRTLQTRMTESALMNRNRAYVIQQLDSLTPQAQNAWLKFLEEPHDHVYCIGWIENENQILPTVKSRFLSLFVRNHNNIEVSETLKTLALEFIKRYKQNAQCADLLLLLEKNIKTQDEFKSFTEVLLQQIVVENEAVNLIKLISKSQKMIAANVPQDQVAVYFCLNIYCEEPDDE